MDEDIETAVFKIISGMRAAYDLAEEALTLFEERRPAIMGYGPSFEATDGRRIERLAPGTLERRALIGAQAFLSNLIIVENGIARLLKLKALPPRLRENALRSLASIRSVVDRNVRNTFEHIDERAANVGARALVSSTILEGDFLCSTRKDGSVGMVAITRETLETVGGSINGLFWKPQEAAAIIERMARK